MRRGRGYDQFWWVSAACSIVQAKLEPELEQEIKLQATGRVAELYRRMLAYRETEPTTLQEGDMPSMEGEVNADGTWVSAVSGLQLSDSKFMGNIFGILLIEPASFE